MLNGKNGDEFVEKFAFPQIQLDLMEPNVCLVPTKVEFVTIFTDFCDAKMWACDSFRFGPEKTFQRFLLFLCGNLLCRLG